MQLPRRGIDVQAHAAVLYGVGARLDKEPALLFKLWNVNEADLVARATERPESVTRDALAGKSLDGQDLSALFGLDIASGPVVRRTVVRTAKSAKVRNTATVQKILDGAKATTGERLRYI